MNDIATAATARHYWSDRRAWGDGEKRPTGAALAALRRGLGHEPGSVPAVIPYYRTLGADGYLTNRLWAEHITLGLFALHQQSKTELVHAPGVSFAAALARLRAADPAGADGLDRRFAAAATATSRTELAGHLRSLVTRLRALNDGGFDYDHLYRDIRDWDRPDKVDRIRRRWGAHYFVTRNNPDDTTVESDTPTE
ncbi:type I-E CRISPR-associated protein Cse2/CasB [Nocardia gamkensis]|uniref:type I-E CRISPR-associated protein Cse2/CasB n=1 Tax=Nocardia gamkensis TaxID=352869 RepID=UPI0037C58846